jgi:cell division septal protein FtsQ
VEERPQWDDERGRALVGKYVLIGLTFVDQDENVISQAQRHGRILEADAERGVTVEFVAHGLPWNGEVYRLPPDLRAFADAAPGEYRPRSTGEVVAATRTSLRPGRSKIRVSAPTRPSGERLAPLSRRGSDSTPASRRTERPGDELFRMGRLALVQPRSVRTGFTLPWQRLAVGVSATIAALALLYLAARMTPVFAVRTIEVSGGSQSVRQAVRTAATPLEGKSLVGLDGAALVDALEALPNVRAASYDRAFPSTLRIVVTPEVPLAVLRLGSERWLVSQRGRIIRRYVPDTQERFPRFRLAERASLGPGTFVADETAGVILNALAAAPTKFPARIDRVFLADGELTMELRTPWGAPELRLGEPVDVRAKLAAAAVVVRSLSTDYSASVGYVDVSVPERTVVGPTLDSKVEP